MLVCDCRPQEVIIFIVGGATYEEARSIALLNSQGTSGPGLGTRFLLGGTTVHNSSTFLDFVQDTASRCGPSITRAAPPQGAPAGALGTASSSSNPLNLGVPAGPEIAPTAAGGLLDPGRIGEAAEGARDIARGIFGRVQGAVQGL
ncbi:hypothetical protein IE81DRAFT_348102 [Ceraceosorus guamensis]|uniref:Sec1-like protein n=1 Tax=Ceraceosorus guamensis TaxID=1522189 RepID=A0A316VVU6_9BASI|nr:hypothetical protein IE81DRAFT_348102 [Ceraceosorus guamensis]PWN41777.1 hypothetical protein IE81DRAFT_348102 [Ceraceosorus guamensis]